MNAPVHTLFPLSHPDLKIWDVQYPPRQLHIQGHESALSLFNRLPNMGLAVVGTRAPQPRSLVRLKNLISALGSSGGASGLVIISGFARGVDAFAHEAALDAGLPTIAVLAGGLDVPYPWQNAQLRKRIVEQGGLLVSEVPMDHYPQPGQFIKRNRLIAGWSKATVVIEASVRSGALNTAKWAREHHMTTYAVPCFPGDPALAGNQNLLDRHEAHPLWGAFSLGETWSGLYSLRDQNETAQHRSGNAETQSVTPTNDEAILAQQVAQHCATQAGATVHELLDWATEQKWLPQRFFESLQGALQKQLILDRNGLLLKNPKNSR